MPDIFFSSIPIGLAIELTKFPSDDTHPIRAVVTAGCLLNDGPVAEVNIQDESGNLGQICPAASNRP
jgi:hypothetical protein